jgi:CRP/FNR family cyclic AMP-dependent transcriptional regulator
MITPSRFLRHAGEDARTGASSEGRVLVQRVPKKKYPVPRDNVVFEAGMSLGALGRERTVLVIPRAKRTKLPSDLTGITPLEYNDGDAATLSARIGPVVTDLGKIINRLGPR